MLYSSLKEAYFPKENFGKSQAECKAAHCPGAEQCQTNAAYNACRTQESFNVDWAGVGTALGITPAKEEEIDNGFATEVGKGGEFTYPKKLQTEEGAKKNARVRES